MAMLDLSLVTTSLKKLVEVNVANLLGETVTVSTMPPELVNGALKTINLYLYHISEDPHYKNHSGYLGTEPPISGQPMALNLYYILTPHFGANDQFDAITQQQLIGLAMKTFHDYPVISDDLTIGLEDILDDDLKGDGNTIEICLRPVTPEDTLNFWAAEDRKTARLSAFYEVRVIFLQPEKPTVTNNIVTNMGLYVHAKGTAKLLASKSVMTFEPPAVTGMGQQQVPLSPAKITLQTSGVNNSQIIVSGENLTSAQARTLQLRSAVLDQPIKIDAALNPNWNIKIEHNKIQITPQPILVIDNGGGPVNHELIAGIYDISLLIIDYRFQGAERLESTYETNRLSVAIGPHIASNPVLDINNRYAISIVNSLSLTTLIDSEPQVINLSIAGSIYRRVDAIAALTPGDFLVEDHGLLVEPLANISAPGFYPIQMTVNGAESQPFWLEVV
ncbi:MAG: DUF4255 domain-containing protein [Kangiella sp.]|nr:DUF4255 domain-containing protein [Kangiella sp.]MCW9027596.1 DUF4255 domain-containing protein [Kangiella sp.]